MQLLDEMPDPASAPAMNSTVIGLLGLAAAGVMAHVALTGNVGTVGRILVGLSGFVTARQAINTLAPNAEP